MAGCASDEKSLPISDATLTKNTFLARQLRRLKQWMLQELRHWRWERHLLEGLVHLNEEDVKYHRQRLEASQGQVMRLRKELGECRCELIKRGREHNQVFIDNVRLRADNSELRSVIQRVGLTSYQCRREKNFRVQFTDTAL